MSIKQVIATDLAPKAIGPYNQAIRAGNTIYFSGQIALDPKTMQMVQTDFLAYKQWPKPPVPATPTL
jgi:2-iminobutanoate/2-iminopropanoate deaminase